MSLGQENLLQSVCFQSFMCQIFFCDELRGTFSPTVTGSVQAVLVGIVMGTFQIHNYLAKGANRELIGNILICIDLFVFVLLFSCSLI